MAILRRRGISEAEQTRFSPAEPERRPGEGLPGVSRHGRTQRSRRRPGSRSTRFRSSRYMRIRGSRSTPGRGPWAGRSGRSSRRARRRFSLFRQAPVRSAPAGGVTTSSLFRCAGKSGIRRPWPSADRRPRFDPVESLEIPADAPEGLARLVGILVDDRIRRDVAEHGVAGEEDPASGTSNVRLPGVCPGTERTTTDQPSTGRTSPPESSSQADSGSAKRSTATVMATIVKRAMPPKPALVSASSRIRPLRIRPGNGRGRGGRRGASPSRPVGCGPRVRSSPGARESGAPAPRPPPQIRAARGRVEGRPTRPRSGGRCRRG